jgi:ABC-type lipoprotein release transport system permease subunit
MLVSDVVKLSLRMFKARTMRTILTIFGMGVGIAAILFLVSFGYGLQRTLLQKITTSDALVTLDVTVEQEGKGTLDTGMTDAIREIPGVADVIPALELRSQARLDGVALEVSAVATESDFMNLSGLVMTFGKNFESTTHQVVVSTAVAQIFSQKPEDIIGRSIDLKLFRKIVAPDGSAKEIVLLESSPYIVSGIVQGDENTLYFPIQTISQFDLPDFSKLKVKCASTNEVEGVRAAVVEKGLIASSISDIVDQANKVFSVVQIVLMMFGVIALVVSAIGMFNTMTITLLERTEEIGIMKAIGASNTAIWLMFISEATMMGFLGGFGGVIIGYLEGEAINLIINLIATRFGGERVDLFYSPLWFVSTIIIFGAFVGFLTGIFPARKASKIDALDALRYK